MRPMNLHEFAHMCGGDPVGIPENAVFYGFALDSREVRPGDLFIAIKGKHYDGHSFLKDVLKRGGASALVERDTSQPHIRVDSVVEALAAYGTEARLGFDGPVIGITGSYGKTTTKELVAAALSPLGPVLKSRGNLNTELTSPLVWFHRRDDHVAAVLEMGMRGPGQVAHLAAIAKPTIGIVTGIGTAHLEMLGSREGIARAKAELLRALPPSGLGIIWAEDDFYADLRQACGCETRSFGFSPEADCRIIGYKALGPSQCEAHGTLNDQDWHVTLPLVGKHQARNAAAALLASDACGVRLDEAATAIADMELPPLRLETRRHNGAVLLVDTYNASPDSTQAALEALGELPCPGRRYAVLGEMRELGDFAESGHRKIGEALAASEVDAALLVGEDTHWIEEEAVRIGFPKDSITRVAADDLAAVRSLIERLRPGDLALIKGSRALELESALEPELEAS